MSVSFATFRFACRPAEDFRPSSFTNSAQVFQTMVDAKMLRLRLKPRRLAETLFIHVYLAKSKDVFSMVKPYLKSEPPCCRNIDYNPVWSGVSWNRRSAFYFSPDKFPVLLLFQRRVNNSTPSQSEWTWAETDVTSKCQQTRSTDLTHCERDGICSLATPVCIHDRLKRVKKKKKALFCFVRAFRKTDVIFSYLFDIVVLCVRVALVLSGGHGATEPLTDTKHSLILKTSNSVQQTIHFIDALCPISSSRGRWTAQRAT